jgi:hypothetical protein
MDTALVRPKSVCDEALGILSRLGAPQNAFAREGVMALSPITGELIAQVRITRRTRPMEPRLPRSCRRPRCPKEDF